jgi:hypothetical protein
MKRRALVWIGVFASVLGCAHDPVAPDVATPADGVLISVQVPGRCLVGGCDPVESGTTLALTTLSNMSDAAVFLPLCGTTPAITVEQFIGGKWQFIGPAVACPFGPRSQALAPHDSIQLNAYYQPGIFRLDVGVALDAQLSAEAASTSAPFTVR